MNIIETLNWRYSTKDFKQIKLLLQMSPSSTNIQPWHFIIANSKEGKERITKGTQGFYQFNDMFANIHSYDLKDLQHWLEKQVYLNMGNLLLGAATLGIDALPMEGIDMKLIDQEFGLREKGFTAIGVVALGYREETDYLNTKLLQS